MNVFVGVDGGATRTVVLVTDADGNTLVRREGPPALIRADSARIVTHAIVLQIAEALAQVGNTPADAACLALTGLGRDAERLAVMRALETVKVAASWHVTTDAEAALLDAFGMGAGLLVIAGTGSIAWGRAADGTVARCGGWGPLLGDEGSAWAIGRDALTAIARHSDGRGPTTRLGEHVIPALGLREAPDLVGWMDDAPRADVAAIAPLVLQAASGDDVAAAIVARATRHLVDHVRAVQRRLAPWVTPPAVALAGGLLAPGRPMRDRLRNAIVAEMGLECIERAVDGARGAAAIAIAGRHGPSMESPPHAR
jgi:glucosamine kinase